LNKIVGRPAIRGPGRHHLQADDIPTESKLSFGLGGGLTYFPWSSVGIRGHFRYKPTLLDDESAEDFCDPFGFARTRFDRSRCRRGWCCGSDPVRAVAWTGLVFGRGD
jgi:hypothetical protein